MKKSLISVLKLCAVVLVVYAYQELTSRASSSIANLIDYSAVDWYNVYARVSVHHILQAIIVLVPIVCLSRWRGMDFYLKPRKDRFGSRCVIIFSVVYLVFTVISHIIGYTYNLIAPSSYPLNFGNVTGTLAFQLFLSGPSEEIVFRALAITIFCCVLKDMKHKSGLSILLASVLFALAHVSWSVAPFTISLNWFQVGLSFTLGILYGITYIRSKSVIYPMLLHSISNVIMVATGYVFQVLWK